MKRSPIIEGLDDVRRRNQQGIIASTKDNQFDKIFEGEDTYEKLSERRKTIFVKEGLKGAGGGKSDIEGDKKSSKEEIIKIIKSLIRKTSVNEDEWKTMHGAHILIDTDGGIIAGGPKSLHKKKDKEEGDSEDKSVFKESVKKAANLENSKKNIEYCKEHPEATRDAASILARDLDKILMKDVPGYSKISNGDAQNAHKLASFSDEELDDVLKEFDIDDKLKKDFKSSISTLREVNKKYKESLDRLSKATKDNSESLILSHGDSYADVAKAVTNTILAFGSIEAVHKGNTQIKKVKGIKDNIQNNKTGSSIKVSGGKLQVDSKDRKDFERVIKDAISGKGESTHSRLADKALTSLIKNSNISDLGDFDSRDSNFRSKVKKAFNYTPGENAEIDDLYDGDDDVKKAVQGRLKELESQYKGAESHRLRFTSGWIEDFIKKDSGSVKSQVDKLANHYEAELQQNMIEAEVKDILDGTWGTEKSKRGIYY